MRLAILGASGRIGRVIVDEALRRGHQVAVLTRRLDAPGAAIPGDVRDPAIDAAGAGIRTVRGDVRDPAALAEVLDDAGAVVSALGGVCADGVRTLLSIAGPERIIAVSNYGTGERSAYAAVSWMLAGAVMRDKTEMERLLRDSDRDWTAVRLPMLTDGPATGRIRAGVGLRPGFAARLSRADAAGFVLGELHRDAYVRRAVTVAG